MGALTNIYVDPAIAADSGTGTIGDPYGDLQYALNTQTRDATNGDQFNVKAGTSEILAAALSFATYGTPAVSSPCIIRGYTAAANDGGIGVVSGNGSLACISSSPTAVKLVDMRFTNSGAATILTLGANSSILNCEIDTTTGGGVSLAGPVINSYFHNIGAIGVAASTLVYGCTFRNETNDFTIALQCGSTGLCVFNLIDIDGSSVGINIAANGVKVMFNSVYSNAGTGVGIKNSTSGDTNCVFINNTIVGFSGAGGIGIQVVGQNADIVGYNLIFNNTTNTSLTGDINVNLGNNDTAGSSPFVDAANDDFDPIAGLAVGYPTTWKNYTATRQNLLRMAAQRKAEAHARYLMGLG